jgi:hypothetical protein
MGLTEGSEMSANHNMTPGKYPEEHIQYSEHGESLKERNLGRACISQFKLFYVWHICIYKEIR